MPLFRLLIAGSSTFKDYTLLEHKADYFLQHKLNYDIEIVSGAQKSTTREGEDYGADFLGEMYAMNRGYNVRRFPADWDKYGKPAGPIRNKEMGEYVKGIETINVGSLVEMFAVMAVTESFAAPAIEGAALLFWNGFSKGTRDMITRCKVMGINYRVVEF